MVRDAVMRTASSLLPLNVNVFLFHLSNAHEPQLKFQISRADDDLNLIYRVMIGLGLESAYLTRISFCPEVIQAD